jgi:hypothetical protein
MTHYTDTDLLIIKLMLSQAHETAHLELAGEFFAKVLSMGIPKREIICTGATRQEGNSSSKEGDSAFKPRPFRVKQTDWPTIVFEAGLSKLLGRLRIDAAWWLMNSNGDVNIVVVISLQKAQSRIQIEKWELDLGRPRTRSHQPTPTKTQEITIDPNNIAGAPLVLEFQKIFLRLAILPEIDFIFSAQELSSWAADIWAGV